MIWYIFRCILSYDDVLSISKLRPNSNLKRLILDGFYINDLHTLFYFYPSLTHLTIHRLIVNFKGFLPPFNKPFQTLRTLKLNCIYTIRFDYIAHILSFLPQLVRLTVVGIGTDFLRSEQWINILTSLEQLRFLVLDIKAISEIFDDELSSSFLTGFWRRWHVAVDYSQDNNKYHLFTVPYRRCSFISTIHCLPVTEAPCHAFNSVTDLYLKTNMPMQVVIELNWFINRNWKEFRFLLNDYIRMYVLFRYIKMQLWQLIIQYYWHNFTQCLTWIN